MKKTLLLISCIASVLLFAFVSPKKPIDDLKGMKKALNVGYAYIPSGITLVDSDTVSCQGFFMMKSEVSNFNYLEYLAYLKHNNRLEEYKAALPDTTKWRSNNAFLEKFVDYYFSHPAYRNYPVVNITREQAENYCVWLTGIWRKNTGNETLVFRLPTRAEFLRAANGSAITRPYAWNAPFLRREDGSLQSNFLAIDASSIARDPETGKFIIQNNALSYMESQDHQFADVTAPVRSYWPNEFGLYNLNGNVSEMISDGNLAVGGDWNSPGYDIRNQSTKKFTDANPTVGFRPVMTYVASKSAP